MVTFHHFTSPRWLMAAGGWESTNTPERFARYCEHATKHLGDLLGAACTINEGNIGPFITSSGMLPPAGQLRRAPWWSAAAKSVGATPDQFLPFMFAVSPQARDTILEAHHRATEAIKASPGDFPVGITLVVEDIQAAEGGETLANRMRRETNDVFLEAIRGDDFVGVQCYSRHRFGPDGPLPPEEGIELTQMGYEFWPEALEASIRHAISVAGIPVIVTENGIATTDDTRRIEYVKRALTGVANCLNDGLDVAGIPIGPPLPTSSGCLATALPSASSPSIARPKPGPSSRARDGLVKSPVRTASRSMPPPSSVATRRNGAPAAPHHSR
jgi:beta-glucosidase